MIRAVIVDDETQAQKLMEGMLKELCPEVKITGKANSVASAYELIRKEHPELVFLDIQLGAGNGFDLLEKYGEVPFKVIFVTAFDEHAMRAIHASALDYILKPVNSQDLLRAVKKFKPEWQQDFKPLIENIRSESGVNRIIINSVGKVNYIHIRDIIRFESDGAYTTVFMQDGSNMLSTKPIKFYEEMLMENDFYRIHRSHLVNMRHVKEYLKGMRDNLVLSDGSKTEVYRKKRPQFLEAMEAFSRKSGE